MLKFLLIEAKAINIINNRLEIVFLNYCSKTSLFNTFLRNRKIKLFINFRILLIRLNSFLVLSKLSLQLYYFLQSNLCKLSQKIYLISRIRKRINLIKATSLEIIKDF